MALLGLLFLAGAIALVWRWLILGALVFWALRLLARWLRSIGEAQQRRERELDALRVRADQQHQWVMQADERGVYGEFPPAHLSDSRGFDFAAS